VRNRLILGLLAGVVLTAALTACGGSDDDDVASEATAAPQASPAAEATAAPQASPAAGATGATQAPAAAGTTAPSPAVAAPAAFTIKAGDYYYEPKDLRARPGAITVTMTNDGPERPHTFNVKNVGGDGDLAKSERVNVNATTTLEFTIMEEGTYEVYCSLPGHADRGQRGTLTVSRT
jgi:plastocyanin